jgi:hypothetical protein
MTDQSNQVRCMRVGGCFGDPTGIAATGASPACRSMERATKPEPDFGPVPCPRAERAGSGRGAPELPPDDSAFRQARGVASSRRGRFRVRGAAYRRVARGGVHRVSARRPGPGQPARRAKKDLDQPSRMGFSHRHGWLRLTPGSRCFSSERTRLKTRSPKSSRLMPRLRGRAVCWVSESPGPACRHGGYILDALPTPLQSRQ